MRDAQDDELGGELRIAWSAIYHPEWDATPLEYVAAGLVGWGRSRRLAKAHDAARAFTSYLGVQHFDPARWNLPGLPTAKFFASFFVSGRTVGLHTYPTMAAALTAIRSFHARLGATRDG
jgi:hypothetical protein